jgi:prepilin-type N-terminal cleavage/methylation domain-containing protein/prepilin-type processing-associated H-X9-DG protein
MPIRNPQSTVRNTRRSPWGAARSRPSLLAPRLSAFTLVELLVVIAIIGILVALLLPAIQSAREAARRTQCKDNVKNIGLACLNHVDSLGVFPTGGAGWDRWIEEYVEPEYPDPNGKPVSTEKMGIGWPFQILPYLEEGAVHGINRSKQIRASAVPIYICPSRRGVTRGNPYTHPTFGDVGAPILMDYCAYQPCTRVHDGNQGGRAGALLATMVSGAGNAGEAGSFFAQGDEHYPTSDSFYDGVIVRSAYRRSASQNAATPGIDWIVRTNVPSPTKISKISDGTSKTLLVGEKYIRADWYPGGTSSDDTGWSDGWDPDIMRLTCISPLNDGTTNFPYTGNIGSNQGDPVWQTYLTGSAHTGGMNAVFADGSVHSINYDIDIYVFNSLGTRNGTGEQETSSTEGVN